MPISRIMPGAIGTLSEVVGLFTAGQARHEGRPARAGSTGSSSPAIADMPMTSGSAKVTNNSRNVSVRHRARAPTYALGDQGNIDQGDFVGCH